MSDEDDFGQIVDNFFDMMDKMPDRGFSVCLIMFLVGLGSMYMLFFSPINDLICAVFLVIGGLMGILGGMRLLSLWLE